MNEQQLQDLALRMNMDFLFIQKLRNKFQPKDEVELVKAINDIKQIQAETNGNEDDVMDFYINQKKSQDAVQPQNTSLQPGTGSQVLPQTPQISTDLTQNSETVPPAQAIPPGVAPQLPVEVGSQPQISLPAQPITQPVIQPVNPQVPQLATPPQVATKQPVKILPFQKNFGDINNPVVRGVDVGGSVGVMDAMLGKKSYVTHTYAFKNPKLEPTKGGRNWGTDFRGAVGDELKNPFKGELEVIKAVDGYGDGRLGNRDNAGFGNQLVVRRKDTGEVFDMAHLNRGSLRGLKPGDVIKPGEKIAEVGKSGNVTGSHLSIETFDPDGKIKDISDVQPIDENTPNISYKSDGSVAYENKSYTPRQVDESQEQKADQVVQELPQSENDKMLEKATNAEGVVVSQDLSDKIVNQFPESQREAAKKILPEVAGALKKEGILSPKVLSYAMVTAGAESGFVPKEEIMAQRGMNQRNDYIAGLQDNYSGGKQFRGRGLIQLTHDYNYKKYGDRIGEDLTNNPDKLLDPKVSSKVLAAYMKDSGVAQAVESDDLLRARMLVQGKGALNSQFIGKTQAMADQSKKLYESIKDADLEKSLASTSRDEVLPEKELLPKDQVEQQPVVAKNPFEQKQEQLKPILSVFAKPSNPDNRGSIFSNNNTSPFSQSKEAPRSMFSSGENKPFISTPENNPIKNALESQAKPANPTSPVTQNGVKQPISQNTNIVPQMDRFKNALKPQQEDNSLLSKTVSSISSLLGGDEEDSEVPEAQKAIERAMSNNNSSNNSSISTNRSSSPQPAQNNNRSSAPSVQQRIANAVNKTVSKQPVRVTQKAQPARVQAKPVAKAAPARIVNKPAPVNKVVQGGRQSAPAKSSGGGRRQAPAKSSGRSAPAKQTGGRRR